MRSSCERRAQAVADIAARKNASITAEETAKLEEAAERDQELRNLDLLEVRNKKSEEVMALRFAVSRLDAAANELLATRREHDTVLLGLEADTSAAKARCLDADQRAARAQQDVWASS